MNKKFLIASLFVSAIAYGASIDHIQTYSPDYLANQAQTGMINNVSANYNPAGLVRLENGKYIHVGLQYAFGTESMKYKGKEHEADLRQVIPNLALYSVDEKGAKFLTFGGIAGGGELEYKGVAGLNVAMDKYNTSGLKLSDKNTTIKGSNKYSQLTLGRAFNIDDKLSVSIAGRLVYGTRELKGKIEIDSPLLANHPMKDKILTGDIDSKRTAWGYGFQLGLNYKASEKLNLAARYDSKIEMKFKAKGNERQLQTASLIGGNIGITSFYPQYTPGTKTRRDLPAILSLGASYKITDKWIVSTAANYYFNKNAKMDRVTDASGTKHGTDYKNGWEIALGNEYQLNDKVTLIGSINYAKTGAKANSYSDIEYAIDSTTLGTGVRYKYDETLELTASVAHFFYNASEGTYKKRYANVPTVTENQKYKKSITAVGISATKKF
ncbi:MAG: outer membrane protein transport protein [Fusobacterium sp.]|nr:outer membrane protein transport protein [Fusobacterium sp.]